jgi:hypothetical protein
MALKDFDVAQLATDALAIGGPDGTASEAFVYASTTYYGVFNQTDRDVLMENSGFTDERQITVCIPRTSITAGIPANSYIFRVFDSTTWQIVKPNTDEQWHEYTLRRPLQ